jgi:putative transposase
MPRRKYSDELIARARQATEAGLSVAEVCQEVGAMAPSEIRRLKQLEEENRRLKSIGAELTLEKQMLQDVLRRED